MLDEHVGVVLKNVMDDKGKRLEINVRPVLATEFQIVLEGGEVCIDLDIELVGKLRFVVVFSRHKERKEETYNRTRGSTALAHDAAYSPHAQGGQGGAPLGRTTLTAANGEYDGESGRRWSHHHDTP